MIVAVTDACIFIDLCHLSLLDQFFSLDMEVHTTVDVVNELYVEQRKELDRFVAGGNLTIHIISDQEKAAIKNSSYSRALAEADKSALHLALHLKAYIISSDNKVRKTAKHRSIPCHGILWIFDNLVVNGILLHAEASLKLTMLAKINKMYYGDLRMKEEVEKRIQKWR